MKHSLAFYVAIKVHAVTGSRTHVNVLFNLGRVFHMIVFCSLCPIWGMGYVHDHFTPDGVVCPPNMHSGLLTVATADNIYYNPRTAISKNSCLGAKISLMQQHCSDYFEGNI